MRWTRPSLLLVLCVVLFCTCSLGIDDDDDAVDLMSDDVMNQCPDEFDGEFFLFSTVDPAYALPF